MAGTATVGPDSRPKVVEVLSRQKTALGGDAGVTAVVTQLLAGQPEHRLKLLQPAGRAGGVTLSKFSESRVWRDTMTPVGSVNSTCAGATPEAETSRRKRAGVPQG